VVRYAVVAAQHNRRNQAEQLFGAFVECTIFIGLRIECEESLNSQVIAAEQLFVHFRSIPIEFVHLQRPFCCLEWNVDVMWQDASRSF
jgi:hypothetical protein